MKKVMFDAKEAEGGIKVIIEFYSKDELSMALCSGVLFTEAVDSELPMVYAMVRSKTALENLSKDSRIKTIWKDETAYAVPFPSCYYNPQLNDAVPLQGIDRIWDEGYTGKGIVIGIADTGISDHPDLVGRILKRGNTIGNSPDDGHGHGTGCASCAGGNGKVYRGVAPECSFISVKVLDDNGSGKLSSVMNGINWFMRSDLHHVDVISLSVGASMILNDGSDPLSQTCALAVRKGYTVVVAAGNSGPKVGSVSVPGCREEVITVGASDKSDRLAFFSGRGPCVDGRIKPDIVGVGVDVVMARAPGTSMGKPVDDQYTVASGTSFSTPQVAGLCALMLEKKKRTPQQIKEILMSTAKKLEV